MPGPTSNLLKRWNCALQPELDEHSFFDFHEKSFLTKKKMVNHFGQSVDAILKDVLVTETIV